jgi:hypothetical protein
MQPRRLRWYFSCTLSAACRAERSGLMHAGRRMLTCVERFSPGAGPGECSLETSHPSCSGRPDCGRSAVLRTRRPMLPGPGIERLFLPSVLAVRSKAAWSNLSITRLPWNNVVTQATTRTPTTRPESALLKAGRSFARLSSVHWDDDGGRCHPWIIIMVRSGQRCATRRLWPRLHISS